MEHYSLCSLIHRGLPPTNSSGVQSNKKSPPPPSNADQSNKVRGPISSEQSCAHNLSLVQWCRNIIELSFGLAPEVTLPHISSLARHSSNVHFSKEKVKEISIQVSHFIFILTD